MRKMRGGSTSYVGVMGKKRNPVRDEEGSSETKTSLSCLCYVLLKGSPVKPMFFSHKEANKRERAMSRCTKSVRHAFELGRLYHIIKMAIRYHDYVCSNGL